MTRRIIKSFLLIYLFYFVATPKGIGQNMLPGLDLLNNNTKVEIPFNYYAGYILVEIKIHGLLPLVFIYDTGAEHTVIFEKHLTDLLGFDYESSIQIRGSDINTPIKAHISRGISLQLNKVPEVKRDVVVLDENFLNLKEMTGVHIDGIVGASFFRNLTMEINYKKQKLILWHPDKLNKNLKGFSKHKIEITDNKPYIFCKTSKPNNDEFDLKLLVDTGASLAFLIATNSDSKLTPPENSTPGNLGKGIGGFISGYKGKMKILEFGEYEFENILTHFQEIDTIVKPDFYNNRNGLIGNLLLERFHIIIDYLEEDIYLKPTSKIKKEFKYNLSGMEIIAFGLGLDNYMVFDVIEGSPADEVGIKKGDIIKRIGKIKAERYSLLKIDNLMSRKIGKTISLKLLRDEEMLEKKVVLRDYLRG